MGDWGFGELTVQSTGVSTRATRTLKQMNNIQEQYSIANFGNVSTIRIRMRSIKVFRYWFSIPILDTFVIIISHNERL